MKRRWLKRAGIILGAALGTIIVAGVFLLWWLNFHPDEIEEAEVTCRNDPDRLSKDTKLELLCWNIQYAASRNYHFFYDGGKDVRVRRRDVEVTLRRMAKLIRELSPDVLMLQEVDRGSDRTHRIDEIFRLVNSASASCWATATYHWSRYVPAPLHSPMGKVHTDLVTASRFRIAEATRRSLPLLDEIFIRRAFNLKRAVLEAHLPIEGSEKPLVVLNTHLSAFSFGDGTLARQVRKLLKRLEELDRKGWPWILAGDFNMLPPGDDPSRLEDDTVHYPRRPNPIAKLYERYTPAVTLEDYRKKPRRYYTYLPYGATEPDRKIDYVFASDRVRIHSARVIKSDRPASDHLPLVVTASVR
jgi:endonuclease/exonuclease/phosphatase family metal-dependent hydrolase